MTQQKLTDAIASNDPETRMWKSRFSAAKGAYEMGEFHQCETLLFRALEQAKALKESNFATNTCHVGLGALYIATGKIDKAREQLKTAMNTLSHGSEPAIKELYAVALRFNGGILSLSGDYPAAEDQLKIAIKTLEEVGSEGACQLAYTISDLALLNVIQGNLKEARELIFTAMQLLESVMGIENPEYIRANIIYSICDSESDEEFLAQAEESISTMQYQRGHKHPNITRALRWYIKKRQERGETEKISEVKERFDLHAKALAFGK